MPQVIRVTDAGGRQGLYRPKEELPPEAREQIEFVLVDSIDEVLAAAFENVQTLRARRPADRPQAASSA